MAAGKFTKCNAKHRGAQAHKVNTVIQNVSKTGFHLDDLSWASSGQAQTLYVLRAAIPGST
jgi:hypothetical protein